MSSLLSSRSRPYSPSLDSYLRDVREEVNLDAEEEHELAERVIVGDIEARDQLARANLWLVIEIARQYVSRHLGLDDLIEEGNLGLLRAVETFDPSRGTRFSTYAAFWIRQSIRRGMINSEGTIRLPYYTMQMLFEWRRAAANLQAKLGREPSCEDVAAALAWSPRQIATIQRVLHVLKANHQTESHGTTTSLEELVKVPQAPASPFDNLEADTVDQVLDLVKALPERDALVLRLRYGLDGGRTHTLQEVGEQLGVTKSRISQMEKSALGKLREMLQRRGLMPSARSSCED